jgi:hypothetical protein
MKKWIVGLLLLANLVLFGWMRWGSLLTVDVEAVAAQAELNPDKIKLMGMQPVSAPDASPLQAFPGVALTLSPPPAIPVPSAPVAVPVVSAPVAITTPTLSKDANCAEWGEFSGDDLARAQQALAELKLGDRMTQRIVEHNHGYWVYIPPMKKRAEVEKKIAQLKERGVQDYFVVQEKGKWLNAVSLGVFKTQEAAQKYLEVLRAKKVPSAQLGERMSKLKFTVFAMKGLETETMDKLKALQKDFPDGELKVSACNN